MYAYSVSTKRSVVVAVVALAVVMSGPRALAQPGTVLSHQKISDTEGGFTGILDDLDYFGTSMVSLGDLDGDGVGDLAVGAFADDDGGEPPAANHGAVWVLFLDGICLWDLDASGSVGVKDLLILLGTWGPCP